MFVDDDDDVIIFFDKNNPTCGYTVVVAELGFNINQQLYNM